MNVDSITIDQTLNPRVEGLDFVTIAEYAERMSAGDKFPAIDVFSDGESYWVVDGFHRIEASKQAGISEIEANVHSGSWRDAKLFSFGVNAEHGKRRTNSDKRKAVTDMLTDEEWRGWSDREIARRCRVHHNFVGKLRAEFFTGDISSESRTYRTKHGTISTMQTENIGKKVDAEPAEQVSTQARTPAINSDTETDDEIEANGPVKPEPDAQPSEPKKEKTQPDYSRFAAPPRTEEEKERDRIHNERVVSRMVRLAGIVKYMERVPPELITFIYRDLARLYHPDKQHGESTEVAQKRAGAFALIADIRQILEVSDAEYRELAKSKGIIETQS